MLMAKRMFYRFCMKLTLKSKATLNMVDGSCIIVVDLNVSDTAEGASGLANLPQCFFFIFRKTGE